MLGVWRSHADFQKFMVDKVNREFKRNPKSIKTFEPAFIKMYYLNLDNIKEDFAPRFSPTGKPSNQQPEIFRSFILMSHFKYAGIDQWVAYASATPLICALVGVSPDEFPAASTHRDFMLRLWTFGKPNRVKIRLSKPKGKHGKKKLPPKNPGIIKKLVDKALDGQTFKIIPERLYQAIFMKTAVIPSAKLGLLGNVDKIIASGDGTCINSNSSPYGKRNCSCEEKCSCHRRFSDPDATWGWDSYHERSFYGHTAYLLSVHNSDLKLDLPIYMRFVNASRFDGVSLIVSLAHARYLFHDVLMFDSLLLDAAHDNYPTYHLLKQWNIKPFIDLNSRGEETPKLQDIQLSKNNIPICADGHEMLNWGFDSKKYRIKYRCPMATGKVKSCPYDICCNKSSYGKITYLKLAENIRLLTPVPRNSDEWVETYNMRTAAERVNNRILTDYQLERPKRYGKMKLAFFAFCNAINVHLDAQVKFGEDSVSTLAA
jgi:hypothetical protein